MGALGFFVLGLMGVFRVGLRAAVAVELKLVGFGLLLVALRGWSFRFPLRHLLGIIDLITP
jgi:hypothetical protein